MGRRLGQHFLSSVSILNRIAVAACPEREPLVIEIGPGKGALTRQLLHRADRVIAVELDPVLAVGLADADPRLQVIQADVLDTDLGQWGPAAIAGNLPYYITSPIIEQVLALGPLLSRAVFLVQKEVALRLTAKPGSRDYGFLTVSTQITSTVEYLFTVAPGSFSPPPKVDSAVVRLTPRPAPVADVATFRRFASACFLHKRKTLRNNLCSFFDKNRVEALPEARMRAEQLSIPALVDIFNRLQ